VQLLVELLNCTRPDYGVVQQTIQGDVEVTFRDVHCLFFDGWLQTLWKATEGKIG
jgi:hypothetical protein